MEALATAARIPGPNDDVMSFWQDVMVDKYRRFRSVLVGATALHSARARKRHAPLPGARVLDIGCGFGETTLAWAQHVGIGGEAVGLDPCPAFLDIAREDARKARIANASFICDDAQTAKLEGFDHVFSAFGVMFFAQPVAALRNLRRALVPGGRMQLLVWGSRAENEWLTLAAATCEEVLPPIERKAATCGPGPFSMSDPEALEIMLNAAGLRDIELHAQREDVFVGADADRAIDFQLALGPAGERIRIANAIGTPAEREIRDRLRGTLAAHERPDGIYLPSTIWHATGVVAAE